MAEAALALILVLGQGLPNVEDLVQLQVEEREILNPLQGWVGNTANEFLLFS